MPITERVTADLPVTIKTQNYSLLPDDFGREVQFENTIALTANLLPVAIAGNGYNMIIRNIGPGTLTIQPSVSENIDGAASAVVAVGAWQWIRSDGTEWKTVSQSGMGTGTVTLSDMASGTAGNLISYDAIGDPAAVATGSSGEVLTSNGAGAAPTFQAALGSGGGLQSMQVFTSTGTWTKPAGITKIKVTVVGGGGGGAGSTLSGLPGSSAAAGGTAIKIIDVSAISSETITVGTGGNGGAAGPNNGSVGGTSNFGSHCSATGGNGGVHGGWIPVIGGNGTGGDLNIQGGGAPTCGGYNDIHQPPGGSSMFGGGGSPSNDTTGTVPGSNGAAWGSGGGGTGSLSGATIAGGAGASGIIIVEEYS